MAEAPTDIFDLKAQEWIWRKYLFYSAFRALSFNGIDGDYAEFGCCGGRTFSMAYSESRKHRHHAHLWAFDSFQGLPSGEDDRDGHQMWKEGRMSTSVEEFHRLCAHNKMPASSYSVVPGFYRDTLDPAPGDAEPRNIALAYIDCDLFSSTRSVLNYLMPRLKHGMIIAFDDYFCWTATQLSGERRAMLEHFNTRSRWQLTPFIQFGWHGQSFVVEDKALMPT